MTYEVKTDFSFGDGEIPVGMVMPFCGNVVPEGWVECDGRQVSIQSYPQLFSVIQYRFGGSGENFNVPDLSGRTITSVNLSGSSELPDYSTAEEEVEDFEGEYNMPSFFNPAWNSGSVYHAAGSLTLGPFAGDASFRAGDLNLIYDLGVDDDLETQQVVDEPYFISGDRNSPTQTIPQNTVLANVEAGQYINFRVTNAKGGRTYCQGSIKWTGSSDSGTYDLYGYFVYRSTNDFYHPSATLTIGPFSGDVTVKAKTTIVADDNLEIQISYAPPKYPFGLNNTAQTHTRSSTIDFLPQGRKISFRIRNGPKNGGVSGWIHWKGILSSSAFFDPITFGNPGGENSHVLTPSEIPEHSHYFRNYYQGEGWNNYDYIKRDAFGNGPHGSPNGTSGGQNNGYPTVSFWSRTGTTPWFENNVINNNNHNLASQNGPWALTPFGTGRDGGNNEAHNNMPPYVVMKYIIKAF